MNCFTLKISAPARIKYADKIKSSAWIFSGNEDYKTVSKLQNIHTHTHTHTPITALQLITMQLVTFLTAQNTDNFKRKCHISH